MIATITPTTILTFIGIPVGLFSWLMTLTCLYIEEEMVLRGFNFHVCLYSWLASAVLTTTTLIYVHQ